MINHRFQKYDSDQSSMKYTTIVERKLILNNLKSKCMQ